MHDPADFSTERFHNLLKNVRGLVLDFDGLIADSEPYHYKAYNAVFERYGHTLDPEEYWVEFTSKGKGIQGEIERHNLKLDVSPETMRKEKFEHYSEFCNSGAIKLFAEARRFLELSRERFQMAVASGSWEHDIRAILKNAEADHLIDTILGKAPDRRREKPAPDIFIQAAEVLGLAPEHCLVVEDAQKGLTAAEQAGMPCLIVRNPLNQAIEFPGAALIAPNLQAVVEALSSGRQKKSAGSG